jgi:hypothetical protein
MRLIRGAAEHEMGLFTRQQIQGARRCFICSTLPVSYLLNATLVSIAMPFHLHAQLWCHEWAMATYAGQIARRMQS